MPWNGSGTFNRVFSWVADKAAGLDIIASRMDTDTDDIASSGFGNCITRDGQGQPTANLPMNNFRHTGAGNGVALTDYATLGQLQAGVDWTIAGGSADAISATYTPAVALTDGQLCAFRATAANATATPTFAPNGLTAHTITRFGGSAVQPGDIPGNLAECLLRYNLSNTRWELLNPAQRKAATVQSFTSGSSATYTRPAGVLYLVVEMVGGGGGGGGSGTGSTTGSNGSTTSFNSIVAGGGAAGSGTTTANGNAGGAGGTGGTGSAVARFPGQAGGPGGNAVSSVNAMGGYGGNSVFSGAGPAGTTTINPGAAQTNTGSGGGGAGSSDASHGGGGGGGAGEYARILIQNPAATYTYTVGAGGAGDNGGVTHGGGGAAGVIIVTEYYQ